MSGGKRVLIAGAGGQLGQLLQRTVPEGVDVVALSRRELDITVPESVDGALREYAPDWLINAGAYTAVDQAEEEREAAYAANAEGPEYLAASAARLGCRMVHVSTDFVFDGEHSRPYATDAEPNPLNVYGASKLAGERAVTRVLGEEALILRTAWVYAPMGRNFVLSMLGLLREREMLKVVDDQIGSPTSAQGLAAAIWRGLELELGGVLHWTDAGVASWYDFAVAVRDEALANGLLTRPTPIVPIPSEQFPRPARRPAFGVLDKTDSWDRLGVTPIHWREALQRVMNVVALA